MDGVPLKLLRGVPLFAGLDDQSLEWLAARFQPRNYNSGSPVTSAGTKSHGFFVIKEGEATVRVGGEVRRRLGKGDFFGEVALIDGGRRTAAITADTDMQCFGISSKELRPFVKEHPDVAWALLEALAAKFREAETRGRRM